jgi:hypothetical protein
LNARADRAARRRRVLLGLTGALGLLAGGLAIVAQGRDTPIGEWRYIGGDARHTRYSPLDQINATESRREVMSLEGEPHTQLRLLAVGGLQDAAERIG